MNVKSVVLAVVIMLSVTTPIPALPCGDPESRRHIGPLVAVDWEKSTFTILDRESGRPISFVTTPERLREVVIVRLPLEVTFEYQVDVLGAVSVKVYAMM